MFLKALKESWIARKKFFLSSWSTAIATFFVLYTVFKVDLLWSVTFGISLLIVTTVFGAVSYVFKHANQLESQLKQAQKQIESSSTPKERKKRIVLHAHYGEAIVILKDIFSKVHGLRKKETIEGKEVMASMMFLCDNLKIIFERRFPSSKYSVSIKVIVDNVNIETMGAKAEIITICRDAKSYSHRPKNSGNDVTHNIFDNTCFNEIFHNIDKPNKAYYINNNLLDDKYYKNSSFQYYGELPKNFRALDGKEMELKWTLPYKSEIVVPITPLDSDEDRKQFLGYLCVDCNDVDAFHEKYDAPMLMGVADGIFDIIKRYKDLGYAKGQKS